MGQKEKCSVFDNIIISCVQGVCKNVSDVYRDRQIVKKVFTRLRENYSVPTKMSDHATFEPSF